MLEGSRNPTRLQKPSSEAGGSGWLASWEPLLAFENLWGRRRGRTETETGRQGRNTERSGQTRNSNHALALGTTHVAARLTIPQLGPATQPKPDMYKKARAWNSLAFDRDTPSMKPKISFSCGICNKHCEVSPCALWTLSSWG